MVSVELQVPTEDQGGYQQDIRQRRDVQRERESAERTHPELDQLRLWLKSLQQKHLGFHNWRQVSQKTSKPQQ
jgi:hypothetical protein